MDGSQQQEDPSLMNPRAAYAARQRALDLIERDPFAPNYVVRRTLATHNGGYGYLTWRFSTLQENGAITLGLATVLMVGQIEFVWQACARTRRELESIMPAQWDGPLFSKDELDELEAFLARLDLSLTPE